MKTDSDCYKLNTKNNNNDKKKLTTLSKRVQGKNLVYVRNSTAIYQIRRFILHHLIRSNGLKKNKIFSSTHHTALRGFLLLKVKLEIYRKTNIIYTSIFHKPCHCNDVYYYRRFYIL